MSNIDDDLINALQYNDNEWIKRIVGYGKIKVEPEAQIGEKRWCDLLVTILNYPNRIQKVSIEVENDRDFDASEILRKIEKHQPYPTVVIVPQHHKKDAWRFQTSLMNVWYWVAQCKWKCLKCNHRFTTNSSITPFECPNRGQHPRKRGSNFQYLGADPEDVEFIENEANNPPEPFREIQEKLGRKGLFVSIGKTRLKN